jgi:hypothetical protein
LRAGLVPLGGDMGPGGLGVAIALLGVPRRGLGCWRQAHFNTEGTEAVAEFRGDELGDALRDADESVVAIQRFEFFGCRARTFTPALDFDKTLGRSLRVSTRRRVREGVVT